MLKGNTLSRPMWASFVRAQRQRSHRWLLPQQTNVLSQEIHLHTHDPGGFAFVTFFLGTTTEHRHAKASYVQRLIPHTWVLNPPFESLAAKGFALRSGKENECLSSLVPKSSYALSFISLSCRGKGRSSLCDGFGMPGGADESTGAFSAVKTYMLR